MKTILVVDDDREITLLIKSRLEASNYLVVTASDGKEGVDGVRHGLALGRHADQPLAIVREGDDRRRRVHAFRILEYFRCCLCPSFRFHLSNHNEPKPRKFSRGLHRQLPKI